VFRIATNPDDLIKVFIVRGIVFLEEQNVPYAIEMDDYENSATHILGEIDGEPFAAGRIRFIEDFAKLERIAVRKDFRGKSYGHQIVDFMLDIAKSRGYKKFTLHAQAHLRSFYEQHGFHVCGELFKEANIDHFPMQREE